MDYARVAALYDIHGNLPALQAVLAEVKTAGVDAIVVGGDVLPGPMPNECISALHSLELPVHCIRGNGDRAVLAARAGEENPDVPPRFRDVIDWVANQLTAEEEQFLRTWPATTTIEIAGIGSVLFCHATPRNDTDIFTVQTPENRLLPVFEDVGCPLVVCGHTHMQFDRMIGDVRVVNAGSVGMPYSKPGAYWLLLGPQIRLRRTGYDILAAAEQVRSTGYPQTDAYASGSILNPQSEAEILQLFVQAELK